MLRVAESERLSPRMVRVHFEGPGVVALLEAADEGKLVSTDKYVKIAFARPELGLEPPYDLAELRERLPVEDLPSQRTYTVRSVDRSAGRIAIDFVVHGDEGIAGPWAAQAAPGDLVALSGPGGGYTPSGDPEVWHLLVGDESALPAIAAAVEALRPDARGRVVIEVHGPEDELSLTAPVGVAVDWLHRSVSGAGHGELLVGAVAAMAPVTGSVGVFAHGERGAIKRIGAVLTRTWELDRRAMSLSAYWALGRAEDAFQAEKRTPAGEIFVS